jgi:hypothetical protein
VRRAVGARDRMFVGGLAGCQFDHQRRQAGRPLACGDAQTGAADVAGIPTTVRSSVATSLGVRDLGTSARCRAHQVFPSACGRDVCGVLGDVVVLELLLGLARHLAEDAHVQVTHGRRRSGSGTGIDTATACGGEWGTSSSLKILNPTVPRRLDARGGSPHWGHAPRYAAAAGVKRSWQFGQQRWVMLRSPWVHFRAGRARRPDRSGSSTDHPSARHRARSTPGGARGPRCAGHARIWGSHTSVLNQG